MNTTLLIDTNYLCHRAFHAMGDMNVGSGGMAMVFGVLRDVAKLTEEFKARRVVFAFDVGRGHRQGILPTYKSTRRARHADEPEEERLSREGFRRQVKALRERYLPDIGFRNVYGVAGYEADDIIASISRGMPRHEEAVIVSSDQDLWQCLRPNVWCYNAHSRHTYTLEHFRAKWGLEPRQWAEVKAYAGCSTDDVPGVPGVGEATAAKWLRGELGKHTKAYAKLSTAAALFRRNMQIVKLPINGTPCFDLVDDEVTVARWDATVEDLGMPSLVGSAPRGAARKSRGRKRGTIKGFGFNG